MGGREGRKEGRREEESKKDKTTNLNKKAIPFE
jgi:hypothetical protein